MITFDDAIKTQSILRRDILKAYHNRHYRKFLELIDTFSEFTTHFNHMMIDDTIEELLSEFSCKQIGICNVIPKSTNAVVLYDQIGTTICLGLQYLKGLITSGYEVYYVFDSTRVDIKSALQRELKGLRVHAKLFDKEYKKDDPIGRIKGVRDYIASLGVDKLIIHSPAANSYSSAVLYSLLGIKKFRIVPGDHHFYTGVKCIDYFFEFREYGIGIANMYRHIPLEKIIKLPFYPLSESFYDFQGFPKEASGKIVILAAGSESKFFGSNLFFNVSKQILYQYSNTIILYIGKHTLRFSNFVRTNHLEGRFILMGYRNDFNRCVEHCDILMGSYPMSGGLVSQISGLYGKPIIGIKENDALTMFNNLEAIMGIDQNLGITRNVSDDLYEYIDRLINDKVYRIECGQRIRNLMFKEKDFAKRLKNILNNPSEFVYETFQAEIVRKNKENFADYCLRNQNNRRPNCIAPLYMHYGKDFFLKFPYFIKHFMELSMMHFIDKVKK